MLKLRVNSSQTDRLSTKASLNRIMNAIITMLRENKKVSSNTGALGELRRPISLINTIEVSTKPNTHAHHHRHTTKIICLFQFRIVSFRLSTHDAAHVLVQVCEGLFLSIYFFFVMNSHLFFPERRQTTIKFETVQS